MKKALILALALWTGSANFAYASAKVECAGMMKQSMGESASHSCCPEGVPCQCSIKTPSNEPTLPSDGQSQIDPLQAGQFAVIFETLLPADVRLEKSAFESPPTQTPLYTLFSVYRI